MSGAGDPSPVGLQLPRYRQRLARLLIENAQAVAPIAKTHAWVTERLELIGWIATTWPDYLAICSAAGIEFEAERLVGGSRKQIETSASTVPDSISTSSRGTGVAIDVDMTWMIHRWEQIAVGNFYDLHGEALGRYEPKHWSFVLICETEAALEFAAHNQLSRP